MKFAIIGAGAMGSTIGGHLASGGTEVYFVDPYQAHIEAIVEKGLTYEVNSTVKNVKVKAYTSADQIGEKMDVIIMLVKGLFTDSAAKGAVCLADERTYILTIQNGVGNVEILSKYFDQEKILQGIIEFGAKMVEPGHVSALISPTARVEIGPVNKVINDRIRQIGQCFIDAGLKFVLLEDISPVVWYKMTKNCGGNPACAVVRLPLGPYMDSAEGKEIEKAIADEVRAVAKAMGIEVPLDPVQQGKKKLTPDHPMYVHLPTTAQDVKNKKKTEIDFLNGAVVRYGEKYGIPTPYNQMITNLVKIIEQNYSAQF